MAARRNRNQARRKPGGGMPGWAWLVLGVLLTLGVILAAPRWLQGGGEDGFLRPHANPDARPAAASGEDVPEDEIPAPARRDAAAEQSPQYDFYTVLPGNEVAMSDAELAASAREEEQRRLREQKAAAAAANVAAAAKTDPATTTGPPAPATPAPSTPLTTPTTPAAATPAVAASGTEARYILQAGAFGASGDAESVKAKIALLGLTARVESAQVQGKTVYRVRMGPYGTAAELAEAKRKLATGGLPALAIRAK
ncbi:MAG TPA: SPOR domain-containing protein [Xanthomonadaceae bacterium]|nr:SPOR domain-containing protein [Xanthomonadaceae bacterium]